MTHLQSAPRSGPVEAADGLGLYQRMRLIRRFEDEVHQLLLKGEVHGTTHLYSGQEASSVGICSMLEPGDRVAATYRGHGAALAMGVAPEALMAELLGRATGVCAGRAGSMNVVDLEHGLIGCFGIIGGSIAAATGQALANQIRGTGAVAVAFFGDGATNQAYFHECLNFASVRRLPLILACENNLYAEFTPLEDATAGSIAARPRALDITTDVVDGHDVWTVQDAARRALAPARTEGPVFLELQTYRFVGHSRSDPALYRKPGELDEWRKRDPLLIARRRLEQELRDLVAAALGAPWPDPSAPVSEFAGSVR
jgi:TPP-dependent pyruvate/acetoin dehydrogenase alpha subunit